MYRELIAELRDYDGPVIYEDADGQHVERTAVDLTERAADAIDRLQAERERIKHEREEQSKGCEYCRTVYAKGDWADGGAHDFRLDKGVLYYNDAQFGWEGIRVNNCPMCGRRLKGEEKKNG